MKPILFKNIVNGETVICTDIHYKKLIDGVEYLMVQKPGTTRQYLMRKDALIKDDIKKVGSYR